jgi:hypothetical protein
MHKMFVRAFAAIATMFVGVSNGMPIVSAEVGPSPYGGSGASQAATTDSFRISPDTRFGSVYAQYDANSEKFEVGAYSSSAAIIFRNQFVYTGAVPSNIFYDFHLDANLYALYETEYVDPSFWSQLNVDVFVNGTNLFSRTARAELGFGRSTLGGLAGTISEPTYGVPANWIFEVVVNHDEMLSLGLASTGMIYDLEYRLSVTTSPTVWVSGTASDPGLLSSTPVGFRSDDAVAVPEGSALWFLVLGIPILISRLRVSRATLS